MGGILLLTLTVASGMVFSEELFGKSLQLTHKTVFALLSWAIYAALLGGRQVYGWRGRTAIRWTLSGFMALLLAYIGSKFVVEVVLGRRSAPAPPNPMPAPATTGAALVGEVPLSALIAALLGILVLSGFFAMAETSMMVLNRYRLKHLAKQGNRAAKLTAYLLENTDKLLGVILLGNNLLNAAAAALVTVITIKLFGDSEWSLTLGTVAVTFLILVFSEVTPKILGASYSEHIALPSSYVLAPLLKLAYPIIWFINLFVRSLLWMLRLKPLQGRPTGSAPRNCAPWCSRRAITSRRSTRASC